MVHQMATCSLNSRTFLSFTLVYPSTMAVFNVITVELGKPCLSAMSLLLYIYLVWYVVQLPYWSSRQKLQIAFKAYSGIEVFMPPWVLVPEHHCAV